MDEFYSWVETNASSIEEMSEAEAAAQLEAEMLLDNWYE